MRELVERILKQIVDNPDEVKVQEIKSEGTTILEISTAKEDLGKVIGKKGRIANALRVIVGTAAGQRGKKAVVEILEK